MTIAIAPQNGHTPGEVMERVLGAGDLSQLSKEERAHYIVKVCESAGLNPLTRPFDIITLNGKPTLYASKGATDQLRRLHNITLRIVDQQRVEDVHVVTVEATTPDGRTDTDIGAVALGSAKGEALANTLMKAVSKAKRRVTLSICGLGLLDESEFDTIPRQAFAPDAPHNAPTANVAPLRAMPAPADVDAQTGEIQPTKDELGARIKSLRELLGWTQNDVRDEAKKQGIDLRTLDGLQAMLGVLEVYGYELQKDDEDSDPAQGTLIEADVAVIDRWEDS